MTILEQAQRYHDEGLNVIPIEKNSKTPKIGGNGKPMSWSLWQERKQNERDIVALFGRHEGNLAVVGGGVSGNLCVIDFDGEEGRAAYERLQHESTVFARLVNASRVSVNFTPLGKAQ